MDCDVTVSPGDDLQGALDDAAGKAVCVEAGTYEGPVRLPADVILRARGVVVIDGRGSGPVVKVAPGASARLEGLTLRGGAAELGAGIHLLGDAQVVVDRCVFEGLEATARGGAIHAEEGSLTVRRSVFRDNRAKIGGAIAVDGDAEATIEQSLFTGNAAGRGAALSAHDQASVAVRASTFVGSEGDVDVNARGTMTRTPKVAIEASIFAGGVAARPASALTVTRSAFEEGARGFSAEDGNMQRALELDAEGRPTEGSPAEGYGAPALPGPSER